MDIKEKLKEIAESYEEYDIAKKRKNNAVKPAIKDRDMILPMYSKYVEIIKERYQHIDIKSTYARRIFLFVILYLYSPNVLIGDKIGYGMRKVLASVLGVTNSIVSVDARPICSYFFYYEEYREITTYIIGTLSKHYIHEK